MIARKLIALVLFLCFLPLLFLIVILICLESKGNPIFRQVRIGKEGKKFCIYKLRTMKASQPILANRSYDLMIANSCRITVVGKILREFKLDEIPQLLNIIKGDMVFIGPRPMSQGIVSLAYYSPRDSKKIPGLTGLWQISEYPYKQGYYSEKLDKFYIQKKSLGLDFMILIWTIKFIFKKIIRKSRQISGIFLFLQTLFAFLKNVCIIVFS